MANLPSEIILDEIFARLPSKSLLRFKSTSKIYKTLITSPNFINLHLNHSLISSANRLLIINLGLYGNKLHLFNLDSPKTRLEPIPFPGNFQPDSRNPIVGSCNGWLLIRGSVYDRRIMLINPCTRFYMELCLGNLSFFDYGFGYDHFINDYKFVAVNDLQVYVCSLKDKKWRSIDGLDDNVIAGIRGTYNNAVVIDKRLCHWWFWCQEQNKHRIVCFDLCTETWTHDVPLPDYDGLGSGSELHFADHLFDECRDKCSDVTKLGILDGCLSIIRDNTEVWVMKEYGVATSWVKVFSISEKHGTPLAYDRMSNSRVLCLKTRSRGQLIWYNVRKKQSEEAELHDHVHGVGGLSEACVFKGSLVTLPDGKRIPEDNQPTSIAKGGEYWS